MFWLYIDTNLVLKVKCLIIQKLCLALFGLFDNEILDKMSLVSKEMYSYITFRADPSIINSFKNIRYNTEKINTDNLLRDDFEMFTVSELHNALWIVVQLETLLAFISNRHFSPSYWTMLPEVCASENIAEPCQQVPPQSLPSQRSQSGARLLKGSTGSVALLQAWPLW